MSLKDLLDAAKRRLGAAEQAADATPTSREHVRLTNPWHAVTIQAGPKRCRAADALAGQRFLSKEAPKLPLRDCTEPQCTCRYRHYDDRRHAGVPLDRNGMPLPHAKRRDAD